MINNQKSNHNNHTVKKQKKKKRKNDNDLQSTYSQPSTGRHLWLCVEVQTSSAFSAPIFQSAMDLADDLVTRCYQHWILSKTKNMEYDEKVWTSEVFKKINMFGLQMLLKMTKSMSVYPESTINMNHDTSQATQDWNGGVCVIRAWQSSQSEWLQLSHMWRVPGHLLFGRCRP